MPQHMRQQAYPSQAQPPRPGRQPQAFAPGFPEPPPGLAGSRKPQHMHQVYGPTGGALLRALGSVDTDAPPPGMGQSVQFGAAMDPSVTQGQGQQGPSDAESRFLSLMKPGQQPLLYS